MDPQKLSQLDPKLRDVYQRVMGTTAASPSSAGTPQEQAATAPLPQAQAQPSPQPAVNSQSIFASSPLPNISLEQSPNPVKMNSEIPTPTTASIPNPTASAPAPETLVLKKEGGSKKFILLGIIVLILAVVCVLFWTKIINFRLPLVLGP